MFALLFESPERLWWSFALLIPLFVHLLRRRRFKSQPWGAMQFVLQAVQQASRTAASMQNDDHLPSLEQFFFSARTFRVEMRPRDTPCGALPQPWQPNAANGSPVQIPDFRTLAPSDAVEMPLPTRGSCLRARAAANPCSSTRGSRGAGEAH